MPIKDEEKQIKQWLMQTKDLVEKAENLYHSDKTGKDIVKACRLQIGDRSINPHSFDEDLAKERQSTPSHQGRMKLKF